jgi:hypothetical protein
MTKLDGHPNANIVRGGAGRPRVLLDRAGGQIRRCPPAVLAGPPAAGDPNSPVFRAWSEEQAVT